VNKVIEQRCYCALTGNLGWVAIYCTGRGDVCLPSSGLIGRRPILVHPPPPTPSIHLTWWVQRLATSFYPLFPTFYTTAQPTLHRVSCTDEHKFNKFKKRKLYPNVIPVFSKRARSLLLYIRTVLLCRDEDYCVLRCETVWYVCRHRRFGETFSLLLQGSLSETSATTYQTEQRHISQDNTLYSHCRGNIKPILWFILRVSTFHAVQRVMVRWLVSNWKGFGRKWWWCNCGAIHVFSQKDWWKPLKPLSG
jgi:hypothetical protein